jgi:opine dehydrogenase
MAATRIAVLGAGHGGHAAAADLTKRGYEVRLHARNEARLAPIHERGGIEARGVHNELVPFDRTTTQVAEAVDGADLVMLVVPSVAHEYYAKALAPLLTPDIPVFLNPGHTGGGLHFVNELRRAGYEKEIRCCESVTLTYICRMEGPATVGIYSYTKNLKFAAFPGKHQGELAELVAPIFPEIRPASSVLETALSNMNAVFHPPGMVLNTGWIQRTDGDFLFYREGITDGVGRVVSEVDAERLAIAEALSVPAAPFLETFFKAGLTTEAAVKSGSVARACEESEPNKTIKSPSSLDHRYMHEDIGYGLVPMAALGQLVGVAAPTMTALVHLGSLAADVDYGGEGLTLEKMGLASIAAPDLPRFLEQGRPTG